MKKPRQRIQPTQIQPTVVGGLFFFPSFLFASHPQPSTWTSNQKKKTRISNSRTRQDGPLRRLVHADPVRRLHHGGHQALQVAGVPLRRVSHVRPDPGGQGRRRVSRDARRQRRRRDPSGLRLALRVHQREGRDNRRHRRDPLGRKLRLPGRQRRVQGEGLEAPQRAPRGVQGQGRRRLDDRARRPRSARAAGTEGGPGAFFSCPAG